MEKSRVYVTRYELSILLVYHNVVNHNVSQLYLLFELYTAI